MEHLPKISMIAAIGENRELGKNNELLWRISDDLKRFKRLTGRYPMIMGRKTFESFGGKSLPGFLPSRRTNYVITRSQDFKTERAVVCSSLTDAIEKASTYYGAKEIFVIGGAQIYEQALPYVDKLYLTFIHDKKEADVFFPPYEKEFTKETFREEHETPDGLKYTWVNLERP